MKIDHFIILIVCLAHTQVVTCFFDPLTLTAVGGVVGGLYYGYKNYLKCSREECCNDDYIPQNIYGLQHDLDSNLYGQDIAKSVIISALHAHISSENPPKALAMSFHGLAGTGKNYVAKMIVENFYKKKMSSKYYHFFYGRSDFPLDSKVEFYQERLRNTIIESLLECERSIFVFDEVDMMTPKVLNVLVPFLDYGPTHSWYKQSRVHLKTNKAIFIFLSNTGSQSIVETSLDLWKQGRKRHEMKMSDFENLISIGAFNEKGGFQKSDTISTSLIDHYVPFLPLEAEHIVLCIKTAFRDRGKVPTDEQIEEVMTHVTFGPDSSNLYAKSGCKRLEQKVASIIYRRSSHSN